MDRNEDVYEGHEFSYQERTNYIPGVLSFLDIEPAPSQDYCEIWATASAEKDYQTSNSFHSTSSLLTLPPLKLISSHPNVQ